VRGPVGRGWGRRGATGAGAAAAARQQWHHHYHYHHHQQQQQAGWACWEQMWEAKQQMTL
jgi:hypothetical protein